MDKEKFYGIIEEKREEIESLDLSEKEKNKLYSKIDESIKKFEENKQNTFNCQKSLKEIYSDLEKLLNLQKRQEVLPQATIYHINPSNN